MHRDPKPENIFLHRGRVTICDFGVSCSNDSTIGLTGTGRLFGTPPYMAPEQWREGPVDTRCDLYAFGCVLYEMLVGAPPFSGSPIALMRQHTDQRTVSRRAIRPEISRELESLVMTLLEKHPQARPATALRVRTDHADTLAARALYKALVQDLARVFGLDHPKTLRSRQDHAYWKPDDLAAARTRTSIWSRTTPASWCPTLRLAREPSRR